MERIAATIPASLVGRWLATKGFDVENAQLELNEIAGMQRFERLTVEHSKLSGKVYRPGDPPGGAGRLIIAECGEWRLDMPTEEEVLFPTLVLEVRRRIAKREGVTWRKQLEKDENAIAGAAPLVIHRIAINDTKHGDWCLEGYVPTLAPQLKENLDSVFQCVDVDDDGQITPDELTAVLGGNRFVQALDDSRDSLIEKDEFLQYGRELLKERGAKALEGYTRAMMKKCDKTKLRRVVWRKLAEAIFMGLDKDGSGTIDRDEAQHYDKRGKFFSKMDCDGDGGVTKEEFVQFILNMEKQRDADAVDKFLKHVKHQCEVMLAPGEDDLLSTMTIVSKQDFIEQFKHASNFTGE